MLDFKNLKRNDKLIKSKIEVYKDSFIAKEELYIVYPKRFDKVGLTIIDKDVKIFGIFIVIDTNNNYALIKIPTKLLSEPMVISDIKIEDTEYKLLTFLKGSKLISDTRYVPSGDDMFLLFKDWIIKSNNIPFYIGYEDLLEVFIEGVHIAGSPIGLNPVGIASLISIISRNTKNEFIRLTADRTTIIKTGIKFVGLSNVAEGQTNVMSLISGNYLDQGLNKALTIERPAGTDIEEVYRK